MKIQHIVYLFLMFTIPLSLPAQNLDSVEGDYQALMDLYESTGGDNWDDNTGWGGDASTMGDWTGIETNSEGRVIRVDLLRVSDIGEGSGGTIYTGNNLTGILPESIGNLKSCTYFNVKHNNLSGKIPDGIGFMENLEFLHLGGQRWDPILDSGSWNSYNHTHGLDPNGDGKGFQETNEFSGPIPETIGNLSNLKTLEIRRQYLAGSLPESIGGLTNLVGLFLNNQKGENPLGGSIPDSFGNLVNLKHLHINDNAFSGSIPTTVKALGELTMIRLSSNNFSGPLPEFTDAYDIRYITFGRNNFTGGFPTWLFDQGKHPYLNSFSISQNKLTGPLPEINPAPNHPFKEEMGFDNYHSMTIFDISYNDFEGPVPKWILSMKDHTQVKLQENNLTGDFKAGFISGQHPDAIEGSSNNSWGGRIRLFEFDNNNFSGELPDAEWVSNVLYIRMGGNNYTGSIPESWESLKNGSRLSMFRLENNELSGEIPRWIGELEKLNRLGLENNRFTFSDILPHFDFINNNIDDFRYYPQKPFGVKKERSMPAGSDLILNMEEYHYEGNEYQWFKDNSSLNGENSPVLIIKNVQTSHEGEYRLEVKNSALPNLGTQSSQAITFRIGEDDGKNSEGNSGDSGEDTYGENDPVDDDLPETPFQLSPEDGAVNVSITPVIEWSSIDADYYILHVDKQGDSELVIDTEVYNSSFTPPAPLDPESVYFWRVRGVKDGVEGEWSDTWDFTTTSDESELTAETELNQNYPNPFNPSTQIRFSISEQQQVSLKVYDMSGRLVANLVDNTAYPAGSHEVTFNANSLASGIYFYRFITGSEIITRKMTLMK